VYADAGNFENFLATKKRAKMSASNDFTARPCVSFLYDFLFLKVETVHLQSELQRVEMKRIFVSLFLLQGVFHKV
jgi:hypothetical protein